MRWWALGVAVVAAVLVWWWVRARVRASIRQARVNQREFAEFEKLGDAAGPVMFGFGEIPKFELGKDGNAPAE